MSETLPEDRSSRAVVIGYAAEAVSEMCIIRDSPPCCAAEMGM